MPGFPFFQQLDSNDCGPSCLRMISQHYGKFYSLENLREKTNISRDGVSLLGISEAAEAIGFRTEGLMLTYEQLTKDVQLPCILHWRQNHFIVLYKYKRNKLYVADPANGFIKYTPEEFLRNWASSKKEDQLVGICLQLSPTPDFFKEEGDKYDKSSFGFLFKYLRGHRPLINQVFLGIFIAILLQLIFPFLFQAMIDKGVIIPNPSLILTILIAQLVLIISRFLISFFRNWIILHLGSRINILLISDFLLKLMKLPIAYFDSKTTGDLVQRIVDHKRVETFLTKTTISLFYSVFTILVLGIVLIIFSVKIFIVFLIGTCLYILWTVLFMRRRRDLDNKKFAQLSNNQNSLLQIIKGMSEIKLNNCEKQKRWEWESIQATLFRINLQNLFLQQKQMAGALFFNDFKDVLIVFFSAHQVLQGSMTLGALVSISYIVGQLTEPINQLIEFFHTTQDAKISLERLSEIHNKKDEEPEDLKFITDIPPESDIEIKNLSFQYEGPHSPMVLKNVNLKIQSRKVTAIVGTSGSGKTTLLKLILGFYRPIEGEISVGHVNLINLSSRFWRSRCGVVMQDGFIFNDTIAKNISVSDERINKQKLFHSSKIAAINEIIDKFPLGFNTKIGEDGSGLSQGQKQRILIARAVYKDPNFLIFDEATNALDASNEKYVMENLQDLFIDKTVIIVAHRLSTVRNADQIVVLEKGEVVEIGNHVELTAQKGHYYKLVKNQLELGV